MGLFAESRKAHQGIVRKPEVVETPAAPVVPKMSPAMVAAEQARKEQAQRDAETRARQQSIAKLFQPLGPKEGIVHDVTAGIVAGVPKALSGLAQAGDFIQTGIRQAGAEALARNKLVPQSVRDRAMQAAAQEQAAGVERRRVFGAQAAGAEEQLMQGRATQAQRQSTAYGLGASIPQMATLFVPGVGQGLFAASAAGSAGQYAEQRGATPQQAALYGAGAGAAELATEKLLFLLPKAVREGAKKALGAAAPVVLKTLRPAGEAAQEVTSGVVNAALEKLIFNPDKKYVGDDGIIDLRRMQGDALGGAILGAVFMGVNSPDPQVKAKAEAIQQQAEQTGEPASVEQVQELVRDIVAEPARTAPQYAAAATRPTTDVAPSAKPRTQYTPQEMSRAAQEIMPQLVEYEKARLLDSAQDVDSMEAWQAALDKAESVTARDIQTQLKFGTAHPDLISQVQAHIRAADISKQNAAMMPDLEKAYRQPQPAVPVAPAAPAETAQPRFAPMTRTEIDLSNAPHDAYDPRADKVTRQDRAFTEFVQKGLTPPTAQQGGVEPDLQFYGNVEGGPMEGEGPTVESRVSENIGKGRVGNAAVTEAYKNDPMTHKTLTTQQVMDAMTDRMAGYDGTVKSLDSIYDKWAERLESGTDMNAGDIPLVRVLANEYSKAGLDHKADQAYAIVASKALEFGRYVNAFKYIYDEMSPKQVIMGVQKIVERMNKQGVEKYGKKWTDLDLTEAETKEFTAIKDLRKKLTEEANKITDATARQEALNAIPDKIAAEHADIMDRVTNRWADIVPSTAFEKWNYWRRFAMLTSPKTHIRNITSNIARAVMEGVKDTVATGLERITFVPKDQRLHSAGWFLDKDARATADAVWKDVKPELTHTLKYEVTTLPGLERSVKPLGKGVGVASDIVMNALEAEDRGFMYFAFVSSLSQQMKARGVTSPDAVMVERAKRAALENTYKLENSLSKTLSDIKKGSGPASKALEVLIPFTRTPAAIAKTAAEFTPGLGAIQMGRDIKKGKITNRAEAIDSISKQIVGSAILAAGYAAAKAGLAFGEDEKSKKAKEMQELGGGRQRNSIDIGGGTYTIDWMQPTSFPFLAGVQLYEAMQKEGVQPVADSVTTALLSGIDTFMEQSMLTGVNKFFSADNMGFAIADMLTDYIAQGIPTLYTQIAQQASGTERVTYDASMTDIQKLMAKFQGKVAPWTLEEKVTAMGQTKPRMALNTLLSPGFYKDKSDDPAAAEIYRVYKERKDEDGTGMLPKAAPSSVTVTDKNGTRSTKDDVKTKVTLTPAQKTQFMKEYGTGVQQAVSGLIQTQKYKSASDEEKSRQLRAVMDTLYEQQKAKMDK